MDNATTIIGIGLFFLFIGPILFLIYNQNRKQRNKVATLNKIATDQKLKIDEYVITNSVYLGIDKTNNYLININPLNNMESKVISLSRVEDIEVISSPNIDSKGIVEKIAIILYRKSSIKENIEIIFYQENDGVSLDAQTELATATEWEKIIKSQL